VYLIASTMLWSDTQGGGLPGRDSDVCLGYTLLTVRHHKEVDARPYHGAASTRRWMPDHIMARRPQGGGCQTISWRGVQKEVCARPYHGAASTRGWMPDHIMARRPQGGGCQTISWRCVHKKAACPPQPPVQHPPQASPAQHPHYDETRTRHPHRGIRTRTARPGSRLTKASVGALPH
jgi:hypothetical protein